MQQSNVHPIFAGIAQAFYRSVIDAHKLQVHAYVEMLKRHDWEVGSDADFGELLMAQREVDPRFEIWNEYAPDGFKR